MLKKIVLLTAILALTIPGVFAQKRQVMLDRVVAIVGGSSILHSEVEQYAMQLKQQRLQEGYTSDRDPMSEALEALMTQKLLYHQGQIDSVMISEAEIQSRVEEQVQQLVAEEGSISNLEAKHHMAVFNIRDMLRQKGVEQSFAQSMQADVVGKVAVIPGEVDRYYKSKDKKDLPIIAEQYIYAQITKFPKSIVEAKQRTKERLLDMRERVIAGTTKFENLARMYSQDGTALRGGELGPSSLQEFDPVFSAAVEGMKPGQVSEVVETQFGFHIIQMLDKRGQLYHLRHILLRPVYTPEELTATVNTLDSIARLIHSDSLTFEKAAAQYSDDANSKRNGGVVSNHDILERSYANVDARMTVTKFLKEDFAQFRGLDDYNQLKELKPGGVSEAYLTKDMLGNELAKIVKLVEVIPSHVASLNEDYLRLEEMALNEKRERIFHEWLNKKIEAMYVYIDPEFRNGEFENKNWVK